MSFENQSIVSGEILKRQNNEAGQLEVLAEEGMSPERMKALEALDLELAQLGEGNLAGEIKQENLKEFGDRLEVLVKIGETLKDRIPEIAAVLVSISALAVSFAHSSEGLNGESIISTIAASVGAASLLVSGLLHVQRVEGSNKKSNNVRYA